MNSQFIGGSEMTFVPAEITKTEGAQGWEHEPRWMHKDKTTSFRQTIITTKYKLRCKNEDNDVDIPPPYRFPGDKNTTCLDYKARYCCKSTSMYRPTEVEELSRYIKNIFPIGATRIELTMVTTNIKTTNCSTWNCSLPIWLA